MAKRTMNKDTAWGWCQKYIKIRDAIKDYPQTLDLNIVLCRSCNAIMIRGTENCQAGHYKSRGVGGSSGVYWDERNIHAQCSRCNRFGQGMPRELEEYIIKNYGQTTLDELNLFHKANKGKKVDVNAIGQYYKTEYQRLCKEHGITI